MPIELAPVRMQVAWDEPQTRRRRWMELEARTVAALERAAQLVEVPRWTVGQGGDHLEGLQEHIGGAVDALLGRLRTPPAHLSHGQMLEVCELALDLQNLGRDHQENIVGERLRALASIQDRFTSTAAERDVGTILRRASQEICQSYGMDRCMIFRLRDGHLLSEAVHFVEHDVWADECHNYAHDNPLDLNPNRLETEMVRRKSAALMTDPMNDPNAFQPIVRKIDTLGYVAAPITVSGNVVATLHADMYFRQRQVDAVDRDMVASFAAGLGYALERAVLLDRLHAQGDAVRRMVESTIQTVESFRTAELGLDSSPISIPVPAPWPGTSATFSTRSPAARRVSGRGAHWKDALTRREYEVLTIMATGASNAYIAQKLFITEGTVKAHVKKILHKLGAANRSHAGVIYLRENQ